MNAPFPSRRSLLCGWLALSASLACAGGAGEEPSFLRLSRDGREQPIALETAIVSYAETAEEARRAGRREPLTVDLVAAVHLGGRTYYETLNKLFEEYDSVLYELVAPPHARVPKAGRKPSGVIGSAQQGLTGVLGLEFQLDRIDYAAANFVHADLSPQQFAAAMARRGESWWTVFAKLLREGMARPDRGGAATPEIGIGDMFGLLFGAGPERQVKLRRLMAEQFSDMEVLTAAFGGEEGSTLITDRNAEALRVLRERIGRGDRRIAIFYGAAHMDDFDRHLREDFAVQPRETEWLEAWDLRMPAAAVPAERLR